MCNIHCVGVDILVICMSVLRALTNLLPCKSSVSLTIMRRHRNSQERIVSMKRHDRDPARPAPNRYSSKNPGPRLRTPANILTHTQACAGKHAHTRALMHVLVLGRGRISFFGASFHGFPADKVMSHIFPCPPQQAHGRTTCISICIPDMMPRRAECEQVHASMPSLTVRRSRHSHIYVQLDR